MSASLEDTQPTRGVAVAAWPQMTVERCEDPAAFASMQDAWEELLAHSRADCLFLTWEWLFTWWKHLGGQRRLSLFLVRDGGELLGVAPLARRPIVLGQLLPFPALEFLGTGPVGSDYLDVIVRRGREAETLDALATTAAQTRLALELGQVRQESSAAVLARQLAQGGWMTTRAAVNVCPIVELAGHTWESYLATLGSAHRYNFGRRLRNLTRHYDVRLQLVRTEEERQEALAILVALHARRWQQRGGSEAFRTPALRAFHNEISRVALQRGWLRLFVLRLNGTPAAVLLGYRYGGTFYYYQSGFDPSLAKDSVGLVTMGLTIQHALGEGTQAYDLLHGAEAYKFQWARTVCGLDRLDVFPPGVRGAAYRYLAESGRRIRHDLRRLLGDAWAERLATRGVAGILLDALRGLGAGP